MQIHHTDTVTLKREFTKNENSVIIYSPSCQQKVRDEDEQIMTEISFLGEQSLWNC